jgi:hypothetical protein
MFSGGDGVTCLPGRVASGVLRDVRRASRLRIRHGSVWGDRIVSRGWTARGHRPRPPPFFEGSFFGLLQTAWSSWGRGDQDRWTCGGETTSAADPAADAVRVAGERLRGMLDSCGDASGGPPWRLPPTGLSRDGRGSPGESGPEPTGSGDHRPVVRRGLSASPAAWEARPVT